LAFVKGIASSSPSPREIWVERLYLTEVLGADGGQFGIVVVWQSG
jgi:hypothetical protein